MEITNTDDLDLLLEDKLPQETVPAVTEPVTTPAPVVTEPAAPAPETSPAPETTPAAPAAEEVDNDPENVFTNKNRQNAAFAQQRIENKQLKETVNRLAKTLGIEDVSDLNKTVQAINQQVLEYEAKKANIPLPVLQSLEDTKALQLQQEQELYKQSAHAGFSKVQNQYKLTDIQVREFAEQVLDSGKNPFAEPVDLVKEYQMLNFDRLLAQAKDEAAQAVVTRQKHAAAHSSTPATSTGAAPTAAASVTSISDLNSMLDSLGK